jgi:hypothetical protein
MDTRPETPTRPDEVNRLWQHGMHEERLFHDRLNYFSAIQIGLLGVFAILSNKEPAVGVFAPLTGVALALTLLWLRVQVRHFRYCVHVNVQIKRTVPEYGRTVAGFATTAARTACPSPARWRLRCLSCSRRRGCRCSAGWSSGPGGDDSVAPACPPRHTRGMEGVHRSRMAGAADCDFDLTR